MFELFFIYFFIFIVGSVFGSFFNVCISRIPRKEDIVLPSSHCPICGSKIMFYHNIPIISYIALRGRCSSCKTVIHWHYLLVELLIPILWVVLFIKNNNTFDLVYLKFIIFVSFGVMIFLIDLFHKIIPDVLSIPLLVLGLIFGLLPTGDVSFLSSLIGGIGSFFLFLFIGYTFNKASGKDGLGGGDIKLIAGIGFFLGTVGILFTILISSILALTIMSTIKHDSKKEFPFGPFLIMASFLYLYLGDILLSSYFSLFNL